jgi:hypothetical protein
MRKVKLLLFVMLLVMVGVNTQAQDKYKNQAMFVYNFTRMNAWPQDAQAGDFVIGIFGNSPIQKDLAEIAATRQAGNRTIVVKQFNDVADISKCQVIFVATSQSRQIEAISQKLKQDNISALLITDGRNTLEMGAAVNFILENDRQRYEVNASNAKVVGITLGSDMIRLSSSAK